MERKVELNNQSLLQGITWNNTEDISWIISLQLWFKIRFTVSTNKEMF
jgi:hypothetical protein